MDLIIEGGPFDGKVVRNAKRIEALPFFTTSHEGAHMYYKRRIIYSELGPVAAVYAYIREAEVKK